MSFLIRIFLQFPSPVNTRFDLNANGELYEHLPHFRHKRISHDAGAGWQKKDFVPVRYGQNSPKWRVVIFHLKSNFRKLITLHRVHAETVPSRLSVAQYGD